MSTFRRSLCSAAFTALLCLTPLSAHAQGGVTHRGYRGHGAQITYPSFLTVTELNADTVSFMYEGAGFTLQRADTPDVAGVIAQMRDQMPERKFKVTSSSATQVEGVGENGWFLKAVGIQNQGATYVFYAFAPLQLYSLINQQFADMQRTLVFDAKSTFGQGGGLTPSSAGCPGCAEAIINTMNNLTQHTAGH